MRIDDSLVHKMPTNIVPRPKEISGDRGPDGDADDRARASLITAWRRCPSFAMRATFYLRSI